MPDVTSCDRSGRSRRNSNRSKAGGFVKLETGSPTEIERIRTLLRRRYLRTLGIINTRGQKLVPEGKRIEPSKPYTTGGRSAPMPVPARMAAAAY